MNSTNAIALILISVGMFFFLGKPFWNDVGLLKEEKQSYEDAIDKVRQVEEKKNELLAKLNQISVEDREKAATFLPDKDGMVRLAADIDGVASRYGISISSVNSEQVQTDNSRSVSEAPAAKFYSSKIIKMSFQADYDDLAKFLMDLEESLRIIDIRSITIGQVSQTGQTGQITTSDSYSYEVGAEIYWVNEQAISAALAAPEALPQ